MTYVILDLANLFFRSRHVVKGDLTTKAEMSLHIVFNSILKVSKEFNADHIVMCLEGRSWRKDFYPQYKKHRHDAKKAMTEKEQEEDKMFWEIFDEFKTYISDKTNCTVLHNPILEADDLISGFIDHHPSDTHIIISTDGDFAQLISDNVMQYNGVTETLITIDGYFDNKGNPVMDKKTKQPKPAPNPEWMLFEKCIRGDTADNVFSAYPGVRKKGTKNKTGLLEAFSDKQTKGFEWNNLMLQRWVDHNGVEHRVMDDYNRNVMLCDLRAQPEEVKDVIKSTILEASVPKNVRQVGMLFMKFCAKWNLERISDNAQQYATFLNKGYPE